MTNKWTNWARNIKAFPTNIFSPSSEEELLKIVAAARKENKNIRLVGAGHSFSPLVAIQQILISLDKLQGIIKTDKNKKQVCVWAGTKIKTLGKLLHQEGLAQENMGDIDSQSLAGAISTGTHGTGVQFGNMSTQVVALELLTAQGEILTCSSVQNTELFKAAQISMGMLGIITKITLQCVESYNLNLINKKGNIQDCLTRLEHYNQVNRNFEFYWFPHTQVVQMKFANASLEATSKQGLTQYLNDVVLENGAFKLVSEVSRLSKTMTIPVSQLCAKLVGETEKSAASHQVYTTPRLVKFLEMEYAIPMQSYKTCFSEIQDYINKNKIRVHFPIENRFVKGDDIWLSPAYQRDAAYIAIHQYKGMAYKKIFEAIEKIFLKYQGRPHWGKMHNFNKKEAEQNYPKFNDFVKLRRSLDSTGMFLNPHLQKIFK